MARVGFKLGGRGRTAASEPEAAAPAPPNAHFWQDVEAPVAPQAPSPAVNILPGQPFPGPLPSTSSAGGFAGPTPTSTPNGWGIGAPDAFGQLAPPSWTPGEPVTAPMAPVSDLTFPMPMHGGDPLDALQQYAALPYGGASPQAGGLLADPAFQTGGAPVGYAAAPMAAPAVPEHAHQPVGQPEAASQPHPAPQPIAQPAESGFADGGIFTGAPFESAPSIPQHPFGADAAVPPASAVPPAPAVPTALVQTGQLPQPPLPQAPVPPFQAAQLSQPTMQAAMPQAAMTQPPMTQPPFPQPPIPQLPVPPAGFGQIPGPPTDALASAAPFPFPGLDLDADEEDTGRRRRKGRRRASAEADATSGGRSGLRRIGALVGIAAVLGTAGWVGYGQLNSSSDSTATPLSPGPHAAAPAATVRFTLPAQLATLTQVPSARAAQLARDYSATTGRALTALPAPAVVSGYHDAGKQAIAVSVVVYKPAASSANSGYLALVGQLSRPGAGNVSVPATTVAPGAAGGSMLCGAQRGTTASAWCAWKTGKTVGFLRTHGSSDVAYATVYTRELRAYAER